MGTRTVKHIEGITKYITNYYLIIDNTKIKMRTKSIALEHGKLAYKLDNTVKLIEETVIWVLYMKNNKSNSSTTQEFDRTILIIN